MSPQKLLSAVVGFFLFLGSWTSCRTIHPGTAGVVFNRVTGTLSTAKPGYTFVTPFVTTVQEYPVALRTYTMVARSNEGSSKEDDSIDLPTKEGQHIRQDISVTYNTSDVQAAKVFNAFKGQDIEDIENTFIRRTIITAAQNTSGQMALSEVISSGRDQLQSTLSKALDTELSKMGFQLDKVNLGAAHLPKAIEDQMQTKMAAQQNAMQAEYEQQKQVSLSKAKVAAAEGDAQATLINAQAQAKANLALAASMTPTLIEWERIKHWDGKYPTVMGATTPMLRMDLTPPK